MRGGTGAPESLRSDEAVGELPPVVASDAAWLIVVVATTTFIVLTARWAMRNHDGFGTLGYDLGIFDQGVWLLSRLKSPFITIMGRDLLGDHTSFILLALVPLYRLVPSPKLLLVAQSTALGLGAVPVFLMARHMLRHELLAAMVAIAFLAHPVLASTALEQFHPDAFEVPLLLFALWFMMRERWRPYLACVVALLLVKEDVALLTVALGAYVAVRHDRRIGLATCALSVAYFALAVAVIKPGLGVARSSYASRIPFGGLGGLARTTVTHPWDVAHLLAQGGRPWYAFQLVAAVGGVCLLAPGLLLVALGPFASNMVSLFVYQHRIRYHYSTLILPVLVAAAIVGVARIRPLRWRTAAVALMTAGALVGGYLWSPVPHARHPGYIGDPNSPLARDARAALRLIPPDAAVSSFYPFTTHLTHRQALYEFPNPFRAHWWNRFTQEGERLPAADHIDYVILPKDQAYFADPAMRAGLIALGDDFETVFDSETVVLLGRRR